MYGKTVCRIGCAAFILLTASAGLSQAHGRRSLPDAPSAVLLHERLSEITRHSRFGTEVFRQERVLEFLPGLQHGVNFQPAPLNPHNDAERLSAMGHSLLPALPMRHVRPKPSDSPDMFGRATLAVSRVLLVRDSQGRTQANSAYLFGAMVTSAIATAYQPYSHHDASEVFGNFGSTIGGEAGMNLFREFWPQLKQGFSSRMARVLQRRSQLRTELP
jgi:hypothetical protein